MKLLIRADASSQIGTGHIMRCLALAQTWQDARGEAIFVMATSAPALEKRLQSEGIKVVHLSVLLGSAEDAKETARTAQQLDASWIVVDGYHFDGKYQQIIKDTGLHLLFIDDYGHADHYYADIVLNQNIYAHEGLYANRKPYTQLLLGTRYALLRREFWQWQGWKRETPTVARRVLVTLGGADPDNVTLKVIQALQQVEAGALEAFVVVGGSNPYYGQLQSAVEGSRFPIRLERNITNMPELMVWADMAVAAGGTTSWELAFMGLPSLILILADNQRASAEKLGTNGVVDNLGWHENVSTRDIRNSIVRLLAGVNERKHISQKGQELVDGEGSTRVLVELESKILRLRTVSEDDCRLLWEWANDPEVRSVSFSSKPIPWENHIQWFNSRLNDPNCVIHVALNKDDIPIGTARYEIKDNEAVISISIDCKFRNLGYGSNLIQLSSKKILRDLDIVKINAYIKVDNHASIRAFVKSGFQRAETTTVQGVRAAHLVMYS